MVAWALGDPVHLKPKSLQGQLYIHMKETICEMEMWEGLRNFYTSSICLLNKASLSFLSTPDSSTQTTAQPVIALQPIVPPRGPLGLLRPLAWKLACSMK